MKPSSYPPSLTREQAVALDAIEAAFGWRLEPHQVQAMIKMVKNYKTRTAPWFWSACKESDLMSMTKMVDEARAGTKGRRKSRAQRYKKACGKEIRFPLYARRWDTNPAITRPCRRLKGHEGSCEI